MDKNQDIIDQPFHSEDFIFDGFSNKWDRMRHFVIDGGLIVSSSMLIHYQVYKKNFSLSEDWDFPIGLSILILIYLSYYFVFEIKTGRTLGKIVNKTLVVTEESEKPSWFHILIRTVLRIPFVFIRSEILQAHLHDVFSKTRVIRIKKR